MRQTLNRRFPVFLLCVMLLLTLCGCRKTEQPDKLSFDDVSFYHLPLDEESVAYFESILGMMPDDIIAELNLSEEEYEEMIPPGLLFIDKPITAAGKEFTEATHFAGGYRLISLILGSGNREKAKLTGLIYRCECENSKEAAEVAEAVYLAIEEKYGIDNHGHPFTGRVLCSEGVFDEIREAGEDRVWRSMGTTWTEMWCVGEFSYLQMNVSIWGDEGLFAVELEYRILPEETYRIEPGYEAINSLGFPISLGRSIRGENLVEEDD